MIDSALLFGPSCREQ